MAGLYLHVPFCRKACHYCDFHFSVDHKKMPELVKAMCTEIEQSTHLAKATLQTIYLGGGTPSLLGSSELNALFNSIHAKRTVAPDAEITLEANPDDINPSSLALWKQVGINRLSIGVQSFNNAQLVWMNRAHNAYQSLRSIGLAQEAGFSNITIDLMFGLPQQTDQEWEMDLRTAINLNIPHLSCYGLTVEDRTVLAKQIRAGQQTPLDEAASARHFTLCMEVLESAGFEQYEISNYARSGMRSRHNSAYWSGEEYLGIGPSAHSFNGTERWWNVRSNAAYTKAWATGESCSEKEKLTIVDRLNEATMLGLRTIEGLSLSKLESIRKGATAEVLASAQVPKHNGLVVHVDGRLKLTRAGRLVADRTASDLFFDQAEAYF